jgi:hypothetical protein
MLGKIRRAKYGNTQEIMLRALRITAVSADAVQTVSATAEPTIPGNLVM